MTIPAPGPATTEPPELVRDEVWQRLDPRMLLVHPVRELLRFLPAIVAVLLAGSASGGAVVQLVGVGLPVVLGLLRYLTTTFRVHAGRVELRRGLLNRHVLSTPLDRVRTVDLTASPIHRLLGLTTVRVGTGTASSRGDDRLDLDGLPVDRARRLRADLLSVAPALSAGGTDGSAPEAGGTSYDEAGAAPPVARFSAGWLRYAPFTSGGLVIAGAILGVGSQLADDLGLGRLVDRLVDQDTVDGARQVPVAVVVAAAVLVVLALVSVLAVAGYLVANWGFVLSRTSTASGAAWHVRRGLLTTRETTLDVDRLAGVVVGEPVGLRLARGRRLGAIVTGLGGKGEGGALIPPAPRAVVERAATEVLGTSMPVLGPLTGHGPAASRRRWVRAGVPALLLTAAAAAAVLAGAPAWLLATAAVLPLGALLALDRSRALGHALVDGYVVARSGSLTRRRSALAVEHVIGWNLRATWFQRRAGLTTLVATTAGGAQRVVLPDVPETVAVELAQAALPGLVTPFRSGT